MLIGYVNTAGESFLHRDNLHQLFEIMNQNTQRKRQKREWYHRNTEAVLEQQRNSERKKKSQKEWYQKNKEKCITRAKQWTKNNPTARKLIMERHKIKNNPKRVWSDGN